MLYHSEQGQVHHHIVSAEERCLADEDTCSYHIPYQERGDAIAVISRMSSKTNYVMID